MSRRPVRSVLLTAVSLLVPVLGVAFAGPAAAHDEHPDLRVAITQITPDTLDPGTPVRLQGTVTNGDSHAWSAVQAYLVIARQPLTQRTTLDEQLASGTSVTGDRVVEIGSFDDLGALEPGASTAFTITVPWEQLHVSGAAGVYPVGVQILATDEDGSRSNTAVGRATTFLSIPTEGPKTPTAVVWPFLMPDSRGLDGDYADPVGTVALVSPTGRLRHLLDLARQTQAGRGSAGGVVLVDPALLQGLDDLINRRHLPDDVTLDDAQVAAVQTYLDDLLALARTSRLWTIGFDRPDVLAISRSAASATLSAAVERATTDTLARFSLTGRQITWPSRAGITRSLLAAVHQGGERPVIVTRSALDAWSHDLGSLVSHRTTSGPVPLLVLDPIDLPGTTTVATLRQRLLAEAAFGTAARAADPTSRADAVVVVDPNWDPGAGASSQLRALFTGENVDAVDLDARVGSAARDTSDLPRTAKDKPVGSAQVDAAVRAARASALYTSLVDDDGALDAQRSRSVADVLGVRWRADRSAGLAAATQRADRASGELSRIQVESPGQVLLSSTAGNFPLTITNGTGRPISVGLDLTSSNPSVTLPQIEPTEIGAGERRTLTVEVDLDGQSQATVTARVVSADGTSVGEPAVFNLRSSHVGVALWVTMGLALALVVVALLRRFLRRRRPGDTAVAEDAS